MSLQQEHGFVVNELDDGNWGEGGSVVRAEHVPKIK